MTFLMLQQTFSSPVKFQSVQDIWFEMFLNYRTEVWIFLKEKDKLVELELNWN